MLDNELKQLITEIYNRKKPLEADGFFSNQKFVPGRAWQIPSGQPIESFEKLQEYENLILEIYDWDQEKYFFIHKGTPFFYCGIHSFDLKLYDRATFYFDTAISEDLKNKPTDLDNAGGYALICLNNNYGNVVVQEPIKKISSILDSLIEEFNNILGKTNTSKLSLNNFSRFVKAKYRDKSYRAIIFSLYSFILDSEERFFQLKVRSDFGGSVEAFITHLSKGCLIFESLLRQIYPSHSSTNGLAEILSDQFLKKDLGYNFVEKNGKEKDLISFISGARKTLPDITNNLLPYLYSSKTLNTIDRWFITTYALRNVGAHTLSWPDIFDSENFDKLYKSVVFSILYLINKKLVTDLNGLIH